jgi:hypothetical protein
MKYPDIKDRVVRDGLIQLDVVEVVDKILREKYSHKLTRLDKLTIRKDLLIQLKLV